MASEIQSVDISCFIHATEDKARVEEAIVGSLSLDAAPDEEVLEGHFGNAIVHATWHITGDEATTVFTRLAGMVGKEGREGILRELGPLTDEHGALYLRLNKQMLVKGSAVFSLSDPIRVRVKPRGHTMKGTPERFYARLMGGEGR